MPFYSRRVRVSLNNFNQGGFIFTELISGLTVSDARDTTPLQLEAKGYFLRSSNIFHIYSFNIHSKVVESEYCESTLEVHSVR